MTCTFVGLVEAQLPWKYCKLLPRRCTSVGFHVCAHTSDYSVPSRLIPEYASSHVSFAFLWLRATAVPLDGIVRWPQPKYSTAERDAVSPSSERSVDGNRSREEHSVAAEAGRSGRQLGRGGQDWGLGPTGEPPGTPDAIGSHQFLGIQKMAAPLLKKRENFDSFSK